MQDCVRWLEVDDYEKAQLASRRFLRLETSVMERGFLVSHICFYETLISNSGRDYILLYEQINSIVGALIAKRQGIEVQNFISVTKIIFIELY